MLLSTGMANEKEIRDAIYARYRKTEKYKKDQKKAIVTPIAREEMCFILSEIYRSHQLVQVS